MRDPADGRVIVLESFPRPRPTTNPYLVQLMSSVPSDIEVVPFSWKRALLGRYHVFHVHWPENLSRGTTPWRGALRKGLTVMLLARLTLQRTPIVRTLHNSEPHEPGGRLERTTLRWFDRRTTGWVRIGDSTPDPGRGVVRTILHGHYRDWFRGHRLRPPEPGRLLFFGILRPYKGVEDLLRAFAAIRSRDLQLVIAGRPADQVLEARVRRAALDDPRVRLRFEHLDDADLAEEVTRAEAVVLPYRRLGNSGAALLALSLDRPVILPRSAAADELAEEVGPEWVATFAPPLTGEGLERARERLASSRRLGSPDLGRREWRDAGTAHAELFQEVLGKQPAPHRARDGAT